MEEQTAERDADISKTAASDNAVALPGSDNGTTATGADLDAPGHVPFTNGAATRLRETTFRRLLGLADAFAVTITLVVGTLAVGGDRLSFGALAVAPLVVLVAKAMGLYDRDAHLLHKTTLDEVPRLLGLTTTTILLIWIFNGVLTSGQIGQAQLLALGALLFVCVIILRSVARVTALRLSPVERCLFVGASHDAEDFREKLAASSAVRAVLVGWLPAGAEDERGKDGELLLPERVRALIHERDVHRVVLGPGPGSRDALLDAIRRIKDNGVRVSVLPDVARVVNPSVELDRLNGLMLLGVNRFDITFSSQVIKRSFDVAGSLLALLLVSPILVITAVAIKLDSRGPVLFRQARAGRHGEPFEMIKFRSMEDGADLRKEALRHLNEAEGLFKIADDPRITRVGRVIRRYHIDELPQLYNVLRGEMSLVGPRPLVLEEDRRIEGWHRRRLDLRPGITGPWQILGASRIPVREMVQLDYQYVADWSLWNDLRILLLTLGVVARRRGR